MYIISDSIPTKTADNGQVKVKAMKKNIWNHYLIKQGKEQSERDKTMV